MTAVSPFSIYVADGKKILCANALVGKMQGVSFELDMLVLPIGGCNTVLGIQWLAVDHTGRRYMELQETENGIHYYGA